MGRHGEHRYKGCLRNKGSFFPSREIRLEGWLANFRPDSQKLGETGLRLLTRLPVGPSAWLEDPLQQHSGAGAQGEKQMAGLVQAGQSWSGVLRARRWAKGRGGNTGEAAFQGTDHWREWRAWAGNEQLKIWLKE